MLLYNDYLEGKGLNLSSVNIKNTVKTEEYDIPVDQKFNYIVFEQGKRDFFAEICNFSYLLEDNGYLIIRLSKKEHIEEYKNVFKFRKDFSYYNFNLKKFFFEDDVFHFIFQKKSLFKSVAILPISYNKEKIIKVFKSIHKSEKFKNHLKHARILCKEEYWKDDKFYDEIGKLNTASIFLHDRSEPYPHNNTTLALQHQINCCRSNTLLLITDDFDVEEFSFDKPLGRNYIYWEDVSEIRRKNGLDYKYETLEWAIYDLAHALNVKCNTPKFNENDYYRFNQKKYDNVFSEDVKHLVINEALGDNILAFNLLESLIRKGKKVNLRTVYPFLYGLSPEINLDCKEHYMDSLGFQSYEHGDALRSNTLEKAYFSMYGYETDYKTCTKHFTTLKYVKDYIKEYGDKLILIAPSASNYEGPNHGLQISNKTWNLKKWEEICKWLIKKGYKVIQIGTNSDLQLKNVSGKFFNKSFEEVVCLIKACKFFLSIDTFFQHLCGLMNKKGIVITPKHNEHAYWPSINYIAGTNYKRRNRTKQHNYEHLKWIKDHLNPYRKPCMSSIKVTKVKNEITKLINLFNKY